MTCTDLSEWRARLAMSQRAAAECLGITLPSYQEIERGYRFRSGAPAPIDRRTELACAALEVQMLAVRFGGITGEHHKDWLIDQVVRLIAGDRYASVVAAAKAGDDGPDTFTWETGIAP